MPLHDGYGVLVGTPLSYSCDAGHTNGHYFHCTVMVRTPFGLYRCPVDLDSKEQRNGIEWRIVEIGDISAFPLAGLEDGWHRLESHAGSGALDYCLSPPFAPDGIWQQGTGKQAFRSLEPMFRQARRLFVFGEPFRVGHGVHNIHQNQGDPPSSHWVAENGSWQDGAIVVERRDGSMVAFLSRFRSQQHCPSPVTNELKS